LSRSEARSLASICCPWHKLVSASSLGATGPTGNVRDAAVLCPNFKDDSCHAPVGSLFLFELGVECLVGMYGCSAHTCSPDSVNGANETDLYLGGNAGTSDHLLILP